MDPRRLFPGRGRVFLPCRGARLPGQPSELVDWVQSEVQSQEAFFDGRHFISKTTGRMIVPWRFEMTTSAECLEIDDKGVP